MQTQIDLRRSMLINRLFHVSVADEINILQFHIMQHILQ